jgi:AAA+ ATPase superfamily predicted ATPase
MKFINRASELKSLDKWGGADSFIVVYGRRRVGKTRLLTHWMASNKGGYSQAIDGTPLLQLEQVMFDLSVTLNTNLKPTTWTQFFEIIEKTPGFVRICLDEFPYLVESYPSLPSIFQKWWDHRKKKNISFIVSGSSQKMMHSLFLNESAPLFGRAKRIIQVSPMNYEAFCQACKLEIMNQESFLLYSMVGGIPKYWEYVTPTTSPVELAQELYFQSGSILENEPRRVLSDEKVEGVTPLSVLEIIGRGAHKPSEISARLGLKQTSLSKIFAQLIDASLIIREIPFGASEKDSKKSLYKIEDPMLRFWYSVYSIFRSRWSHLSSKEKNLVIHQHASQIFEIEARKYLHGSRFWDDKVEFDIVTANNLNKLSAFEAKFDKLSEETKRVKEED